MAIHPYQFQRVGSYVYDAPTYTAALGGFGLGAADPVRQSMCASACDGAGFRQPGKAAKIAKCVTACHGAANVGNCDGKCNPAYGGAGAGGRRAKCTAACQSTFVSAAAPPPMYNGNGNGNGGNGAPLVTNGNGGGFGTILIIGGVALAGYLAYKYMKG